MPKLRTDLTPATQTEAKLAHITDEGGGVLRHRPGWPSGGEAPATAAELEAIEAFATEEHGQALADALARVHLLEHALDLILSLGIQEAEAIAARALGANNTMDVASAVDMIAGASGVNATFLHVRDNVLDAYNIARRQLTPAQWPRLARARDLVLEKFTRDETATVSML